MNPFKYAVSLRIRHPTMDPDEITRRLFLRPFASWKAGDPRKAIDGTVLEGLRESSYWTYRARPGSEMELSAFLLEFTSALEAHRAFLADIRATGGVVEYFIGWFSGWNSADTLTFQLLDLLAKLQIDLALDIYCDDEQAALEPDGSVPISS
jgi:hypothetical protein